MPILFTTVGAGNYGAKLVGNLHADGLLDDAKLVAFVDTQPSLERLRQFKIWRSPGLKLVQPGQMGQTYTVDGAIPVFKTLNDWQNAFKAVLSQIVVDIALPVGQSVQGFMDYAEAGAKQFILPKPFSYDTSQLNDVREIVDRQRIKAAVASNWFYSQITADLKAALARLKQTYPIERVVLNYSKYNANPLVEPTHEELPHALQILVSTGLINPETDRPKVTTAEKHKVSVQYLPGSIEKGVVVNAFLDTKSNTPTGRERKLEIYLKDGDPESDIIADYDIQFIPSGEAVLNPGSIRINTPILKETKGYEENTLLEMYKKLIAAFKKPLIDFNRDPTVLTLQEYIPILKQIEMIYQQWLPRLST